MPKEMNYIQMQNQYPFPQIRQSSESGKAYQVKKVIQYDSEPRFIIKEKIRMLKSLGFQNLIGLQSTTSEENAITLYFQCVPYQFLAEVNTLSEEKMTNVYNGMLELCDSLASRSIVHELDVNRVGLDKKYNVKYFLGVDFKIDKAVDKQKTNQNYKNQISSVFVQFSKNAATIKQNKVEKVENPKPIKPINIDKPNKNETKFQINVKNVLNFDENRQRRILKKSSILDSKDDDIRARKASNRFTFNNDNHIQLPINEKTDDALQKQANKPLKIQDLSVRINRLKCYMREVTGKIGHKNHVSPINSSKIVNGTNGDVFNINVIKSQQATQKNLSPHNKKRLTPTKFSKFQKKVAQFRTSKLTPTSNNDEIAKKSDQQSQTHGDHKIKCNHTKSLQQTNQETKNDVVKNPEQALSKTVDIPKNPPVADDCFKKNALNLNIIDEDRQHKEYLMLANKDKYCEQFMNFLEDNNEPSLKSSLQDRKPLPGEPIRISSPYKQPEESPRKKNNHLRQNLKTQSSENALQIQNRVQKVIRSSLKLINGLRSRQTIRCE